MTDMDAERETEEVQIVGFRVGPQEFALEILQVARILRYEPPARLPDAPAFLEGVVPFEGGVVPVVDLRKRLQVPAGLGEETRLVIVGLEAQFVAIVVDAVTEVLRLPATAIAAPPPMVRGLAAAYIAGIVARPGRTIVVLNAPRILNSDERLALAALDAA